MATPTLANATQLLDNITQCHSTLPNYTLSSSRIRMSVYQEGDIHNIALSSFEIILIAACSSFLTLIFAGLFNFLKLNIAQQESAWRAPNKPHFDALIRKTKDTIMSTDAKDDKTETALHSSSFPPQNRYYEVVSQAYNEFLDAIHGTERDGWIYQGVKKGVRRYKKDVASSPFSLFRGEKILNYAQNVLLHAVRNRDIRLMIADGQMRDCGALEVIDENCKIEFEEYRSPAPFVGAREFVYIDTIHRLPDDTIISFGRSVLHPARSQSDKFTRAQLLLGGWALLPIADEANKTKVVYLVRANLGGSVPAWLINQITSDIPMTVERLNVSLAKIDVEEFNKPIMNVLLYGPTNNIATNIKNDDEEKSSFKYYEASEAQKVRFAQIIQTSGDLWSSEEYLSLIPKNNREWILREPILINGTIEEHEALLDRFVIPDKSFKYKSDVEEAFCLFNKWRKWQNGREWKEKAQKEDLKIYSHSVPNEAVDIIKGEAIVPFSVPIICGVLLNPHHRRKWDTKLDEVIRVAKASENTSIIYISVKTPTVFVTYRDMIAITFFYTFEDGSMLLGSRSILHPKYPAKKTRVRAKIHLDFWHIRPHYECNASHSFVTHYAHLSLGGSLPNWIVNEASVDIPSGIIKVRNYIKSIMGSIHKAGVLYIPPFPFLKSMAIDIKWMDLNPNNEQFEKEKENMITNKKKKKKKKVEEEEEKKEEIMKMCTKSPASALRTKRMPSAALSANGSICSHSSVGSIHKRHKTPNYNLVQLQMKQETIGSIHSSLSQRNIKRSNSLPQAAAAATVATKSVKQAKAICKKSIILRREEWQTGKKLKLREIKIENAALQSMSSILSQNITKQQLQQQLQEEEFEELKSEKEKVEFKEIDYKYLLQSSLSVRDAASYMTLANCAVSELLQETDPTSKEYWVPSDAKTPRGIFVYKFIHSRERYYHYMGKAILHHEPKFIYDAICDPSFRYQYDKMLDCMQIIDKLDDSTYIARYLHTNKQCALIKQERETIVVVRHRTVCNNDKYVCGGMSIEHKQFPTEFTIAVEEETRSTSSHSQISDLSKQLSGKGPTKSIKNGILRTDVKSSGWIIERNVKKPSDSIVSYITNINFGGSVPSALLKSIAKKQPLAIYYLGKALKQRAKKIKLKRRQLRQQQQHAQQQTQQQQQQQHHSI